MVTACVFISNFANHHDVFGRICAYLSLFFPVADFTNAFSAFAVAGQEISPVHVECDTAVVFFV